MVPQFTRIRRCAHLMLLGSAVGSLCTLILTQPHLTLIGGPAQAIAAEPSSPLDIFREVYDTTYQRYVTPPDEAKLVEGAIKGLVRAIDPHSEYLDAQSFRTAQEEALGVFGGLGLKVSVENGLLKVASLVPNSHAAKAGLKLGDLIIRIDGIPVQSLTVNRAVERTRGPVDSTIPLTIARKGRAAPLEMLVGRDLIRVQTVSSHAIDADVGYIKITKFNDLTGDSLQKALQDLSARVPANRLKGYVLDLRNNPGGVLEQAVAVTKAFLNAGDIVVTRGRNPEDNKRFVADGSSNDLAKKKPLIVLINGETASAAEIVAGAIQAHKRATVLGTLSFGKGSVQETLPIGTANGALRLTTAMYYMPDGSSIQARGITPDVEVMQQAPQIQSPGAEIVSEATLRNHLKGAGDERRGSESYIPQDPKDDKALRWAVDLLRGVRSHPAFQANSSQAN
jgi:carboxyl-terminal processing protease